MTSQVYTVTCQEDYPPGAGLPEATVIYNHHNLRSPCQCYQDALDDCTSDVIIMAHDDLEIMDPDWISKVMSPFYLGVGPELTKEAGDNVVAVGLGGATGLGNRDLYRKPYNIWNMARSGYASNQKDAEVHGERFTGVRKVAVLDAFFMAVRTSFLHSIGGWPVHHLSHHCMDLWLACEAARAGKSTYMIGLECWHRGGGTSVGDMYARAPWLQGHSIESDHAIPHKWLFNEYRDVLPIEVAVTNSI